MYPVTASQPYISWRSRGCPIPGAARIQVVWHPGHSELVPDVMIGTPAGTGWSLTSLPNQAILGFFDSMDVTGLLLLSTSLGWYLNILIYFICSLFTGALILLIIGWVANSIRKKRRFYHGFVKDLFRSFFNFSTHRRTEHCKIERHIFWKFEGKK